VSRRIAIAVLVVLIGAVAVGTSYIVNRSPGPLPPALPAELTDPLARKMIEGKRHAVLAAVGSSLAWGELGMAFDAHEAAAEAETCYRQAMALDSNDARWPYLLAMQLNRQSSTDAEKEAVVALYRLAVDRTPPTPSHRTTAILTLADLLTELGRSSEATPLYERAFATDPADPLAAYRIGVAAAEKGETEKAIRILMSLARNPYARKKSATALAELYRKTGNTKEADGFDYAVNLLPPDHHWANPFAEEVAKLRRGRRALMDLYVAQEAGRDDRATVHTATALADQYPSIETQMLLLRALVNAGEYLAAVAVADDILRDPEGKGLVTAHSFLGLARLGLADQAEAAGRKSDADQLLAQAAASLGESVRLKPDYAPGHLYGSKALLRLGRLPEAEASARAGVACRPEEWEGYLALADVLVAAGRKAEAVAAVENAVKLAHPNEPRPKQVLESLKK
jgi:tetratricopeptide (TPR) repeat protein